MMVQRTSMRLGRSKDGDETIAALPIRPGHGFHVSDGEKKRRVDGVLNFVAKGKVKIAGTMREYDLDCEIRSGVAWSLPWI